MSFPVPALPPFLSGRSIVVVDGALLEDDDRAAELLGTLRELTPEMDTFARMPAAGLLAVHMDPPGPTPSVSGHTMLGVLDDAAVDALLGQVGPGTTSALLFAELRHIGGAVGRPVPDAALSHLPGTYTLFCAAVAATPEMAAAGRADADALVEAMAPWADAMRVLTLTETVVDTATGVDADSWARLREVRAEVDPAGVFLANHEIS